MITFEQKKQRLLWHLENYKKEELAELLLETYSDQEIIDYPGLDDDDD